MFKLTHINIMGEYEKEFPSFDEAYLFGTSNCVDSFTIQSEKDTKVFELNYFGE